MRFMNYFKIGKKSAQIAKDRLHIIIAQERVEKNTPDYLPLLRKEILEVITKYTKVNIDQVSVDFQRKDNNSVLELNVILPETEKIL